MFVNYKQKTMSIGSGGDFDEQPALKIVDIYIQFME